MLAVAGAHHAIEVALHDAHACRILARTVVAEVGGWQRRYQRQHGPQPSSARGHQQRQQHQRDVQLEIAFQHLRRDDRHQHRAERAADRHHQIETRQVLRIGLQARHLAVAEHAADEQPGGEQRDKHDEARRASQQTFGEACHRRRQVDVQGSDIGRHQRQQHQQQHDEQRPYVPARVIEAQDEGDQVQRQRHHPQERHAGDVLRDVIADGQQHHRAHRGQHQPHQLSTCARRRGRGRRAACRAGDRLLRIAGMGSGCAHRGPASGRAHDHEQRVDQRPAPAELPQIERRLEQHREAQQRQQRGEVAEREQPVWHRRAEALPVPALQQRRGGRQQEVRQPDGDQQQHEDAQDWLLVAARFPGLARQDRQGEQRQQQQSHVQQRLLAHAQPRAEVGVRVTGQQDALEEHQAGSPDRRRTAEPRQDLLGDDRLHQEQQEGRQEDGAGVGQDRSAARRRRRGSRGV